MAKRPPQHVPHYARPSGRAPLTPGQRAKRRAHDRERAKDPARKLYQTKAWREEREKFLRDNPRCKSLGCGNTSKVVDHREPHEGDPVKFWDKSNWDALCETCHNRKTARHDGGFGNRKRKD